MGRERESAPKVRGGAMMKNGVTIALRNSLPVGTEAEREKKESRGPGFGTGKRVDKFVSEDLASRWPQTKGACQAAGR